MSYYDDKREESIRWRSEREEEERLLQLSIEEAIRRDYKEYGIDIYGYGSDEYTALDYEKRDSDRDIFGYDRKGYKNRI